MDRDTPVVEFLTHMRQFRSDDEGAQKFLETLASKRFRIETIEDMAAMHSDDWEVVGKEAEPYVMSMSARVGLGFVALRLLH